MIEKKQPTLKEIFYKINRECKIYGKDIKSFFRDYDTLRKGIVTVPKFELCLSLIQLELSKKELDLLKTKYLTVVYHENMINYK